MNKMIPSRRFLTLQSTIKDSIYTGLAGNERALSTIFRSFNDIGYFLEAYAKLAQYSPYKLKSKD